MSRAIASTAFIFELTENRKRILVLTALTFLAIC